MAIGSNPLAGTTDENRDEVQKVLASRLLAQSPRQAKLFEYLCDKALRGEVDQIKEFTIAVDVYGRSADFGDKQDSIVRVEAHRLRRKLARYYETEGLDHRVHIAIRAGQYVPEFQVQETQPEQQPRAVVLPVAESAVLIEPVELPAKLPASRSWIWIAAAATVVLAVGAAWIWRARQNQAPTAKPVVSAPVPLDAVSELRILGGYSKPKYVSRFGEIWGADRFFHGGESRPGPKLNGWRVADAGLFQSLRYGEFTYDIPATPGIYELRLFFAEPVFGSGVDTEGENERRFNVKSSGRPLLENFDVVSDSGIAAVDIRAFKDVTPDPDGYIHLRFSSVSGAPFLSALELTRGTPGRMRPIRFRAHELYYIDRQGRAWSPDNYFAAGRLGSSTHEVKGTENPELYEGERYGNFSYLVPVAPGTYAVTLHFAETWFDPSAKGEDAGGAGSRIFDVSCNGTNLLRNFDIVKEAGGTSRALDRTFHGLHPNGQGKLQISFSPVKNYAEVRAIEIIDETDLPSSGSKPSPTSASSLDRP